MAKIKKTEEAVETLVSKVKDLRAEIRKLSMQLSKMQVKNTTQLRTKKDELARVLTTLNMQKFMTKQEKSVRQAQDEKEETK